MQERRERILKLLLECGGTITAASLAEQLGVTRQVIVSDIALLRAKGHQISATPRGYCLRETESQRVQAMVACSHSKEQLEEELYAIVDNGGSVRDVSVDHPIYGQISAELQLSCRRDVADFLERCETMQAHMLSDMSSDSVHLHTISGENRQVIEHVLDALREKGILIE